MTTATMLRSMLDHVSSFPLADEVSRARWLALLATLAIRDEIDGPVPIFVIDANAHGLGKSLLVRGTVELATGRPVSVSVYPKYEEEMHKLLSAHVQQDAHVIFFDDVDVTRSDELAVFSTSSEWTSRPIGKTSSETKRTRSTVIIAGTNIAVVGDTVRRSLRITLSTTPGYTQREMVRGQIDAKAFKHTVIDRQDLRKAVRSIAGGSQWSWGAYEQWVKAIGEPIARIMDVPMLGRTAS